jgi:AhpD family alkylhydroperoxidase
MPPAAFIAPPERPPWYLRAGIAYAERQAGHPLLPARLLAWYPPAAVSSGVLEALIADGRRDLSPRLLQLVRLQTSLAVSCPFCIEMNSADLAENRITADELAALQGARAIETVATFSDQERLALHYARLISASPLAFPPEFVQALTAHFTEREIVILASTAAQVNYWARLIQALGIPMPGLNPACALPAQEAA